MLFLHEAITSWETSAGVRGLGLIFKKARMIDLFILTFCLLFTNAKTMDRFMYNG